MTRYALLRQKGTTLFGGPTTEHVVIRTVDGGQTWERYAASVRDVDTELLVAALNAYEIEAAAAALRDELDGNK